MAPPGEEDDRQRRETKDIMKKNPGFFSFFNLHGGTSQDHTTCISAPELYDGWHLGLHLLACHTSTRDSDRNLCMLSSILYMHSVDLCHEFITSHPHANTSIHYWCLASLR